MNYISQSNLKGKTNFKDLIATYTRHWKWFAILIIAALILAFVLIRYTTPEFEAKAKIQVLEDKDAATDMNLFQDLEIFSGSKNKVEDELEIINSRANNIEMVKELGINVRVIALGKITDSDVYYEPPIKLNFILPDSIFHSSKLSFYIEISSETTFGYSEKEDEPFKVSYFGQSISSPIGDVIITPNIEDFEFFKGKRYKVKIDPVSIVAQKYQEKIKLLVPTKFSNIINISLRDPIQDKAIDILNTIIRNYNKNAIKDKKAIADRTSEFIDERITEIYSDLSSVDQSAVDFKTGRRLTDIASESNINLNMGAANQQELQNTQIQLNIASSMKDIVDTEEGFEVLPLPSSIGLADPTLTTITANYNQLILERNRLLKSSNEKNPIIVNLDQQLVGLKRDMRSSLNSMTNNLSLQANSQSGQLSRINSRIYSAPKNERALRDITRQQQTKESLYLYLLQKKEESQIGYATTSPRSKIIDRAYISSQNPVTPKKPIIYLAAIILGLFIPFSVIYAQDLLDNKIHNKTGLEKLIKNVPVLAELPRLSKKQAKLILKDDRSVLAESLRILRTNLDYLVKSKGKKGKNNLIFVTSSVSGEGKTFLSSNLTMVLANTNKKVLLIGADIRNPKLYAFFTNSEVDKLQNFSGKRDKGLTEYLYDESLNTKDITNSMLVHTNTIDVIYSGKIPPNPAELLMSDRMKELFNEVAVNYDYVIVDTAPLLVVTDTLLISKYADHIIYVTRAGVTETKILEYPIKLVKEGKLKGLSFVVNDVRETNLGYGRKYGYGYGKQVKKWWKF